MPEVFTLKMLHDAVQKAQANQLRKTEFYRVVVSPEEAADLGLALGTYMISHPITMADMANG